ncbi:Hypoxic response protein 1 (plasmid) [Paracoccaceae bacterium]|nr:Hypoxic response protein 1 [Paracoccaceae bacterium]
MSEPSPKITPIIPRGNQLIAARLQEYSDLLAAQGEDGFRVRAYGTAAHEIDTLPTSVRAIFETGGTAALVDLRGFGRGIAAASAELRTTRHRRQLDRLKGSLTPEVVFRTIPGIGTQMARRLVDVLEVETLEDLETALRLDKTPVPHCAPGNRLAENVMDPVDSHQCPDAASMRSSCTPIRRSRDMDVSEAMHVHADWASADTPVSEIAIMMMKDDIGAIPVGKDDRLIGMITDRDIALRVVAAGLDPKKTTAEQVMTRGIVFCRTSETLEDAIHLMDQKKIRRLPVLDKDKRLVGMLSLGDIAHSTNRELSGELLHAIADHHK